MNNNVSDLLKEIYKMQDTVDKQLKEIGMDNLAELYRYKGMLLAEDSDDYSDEEQDCQCEDCECENCECGENCEDCQCEDCECEDCECDNYECEDCECGDYECEDEDDYDEEFEEKLYEYEEYNKRKNSQLAKLGRQLVREAFMSSTN